MRNNKKILFAALLPLFCQMLFAQENHCIEGMFFDEILSKFTTRRTISPEPINRELVREIPKLKIGFELDKAKEKTLKDAGANELVFKLIRENVLPEIRGSNSIYEKFSENYQSNDVEKLKSVSGCSGRIYQKIRKQKQELLCRVCEIIQRNG